MEDSITLAKSLIDVLDYISDNLGATVDWSSENVVPYLKELGTKIVNYKQGIATMYLALGIVLVIAAVVLAIVAYNESSFGWGCMSFGCIVFGVLLIIYNTETLIACNTFPEKVIIEYIKSIQSSVGQY